jgi:hypothetical protein
MAASPSVTSDREQMFNVENPNWTVIRSAFAAWISRFPDISDATSGKVIGKLA